MMTAGNPKALLEFEERLRFETLIADLSSEFVNLPSDDVDRAIEDAQRRVCECLGLDLSALWEWSTEAPHTFTLSHLYRTLGGPPTPEAMEAREYFPWCQQQVLAGKVVAISSLQELPAEASRDREVWLRYGTKSNLTLPLSAGGGPTLGALSFNTVRAERTWPESIVKRLGLIGQIFTNALVRKRTELALRRSELKYRQLYASMMDAFVSVAMDGRILEFNGAYRNMLGYSEQELRQLNYLDLTPARWHAFEAGIIAERVLPRGTSEVYEKEYRRKDGTVFPVELRTFLIRDEAGRPAAMWAIVRDITQRKRAENEVRQYRDQLEQMVAARTASLEREIAMRAQAVEALQASEAKYRNLVDTSTCIVLEWDPRGTVLFLNEYGLRFFGFAPEEILGHNVLGTIVEPVDSAGSDLRDKMQRIQQRPDDFYSSENENVRRDGEKVWIAWTNKGIRNEAGQLVKTLSVGIDRTELRQAEKALRDYSDRLEEMVEQRTAALTQSEERFRLSMEASRDGIWDWDVKSNVTYFSPNYYRILGHEAGAFPMTSDAWKSMIHPEDLQKALKANTDCIEGRCDTFEVEFRMKAKDGDWRWILGRGKCISRDGQGRALRLVGTHVDISERKRAEDAYRIEEKRLRSVIRITRQKANSLRDLLDKALEEAIALSDSKLGYIYYYSEGQQEFTLHAWSRDVMQECGIPNPPTVYQLDKTGLWGEPVRQRRPIVVNDFSAPNPMKKGYPAGHAHLFRYMTLPVFCEGHIVAVVGVANKAEDYTDLDVQQLTMMMDSIWEVAERKRAEEAVRVLAGKLLTAQEEERSRIAREMHDDLTQRIAVLAIEAGKLEQAPGASESLSGNLREMKDQLIRLSQDVHALSRQLHPSILDDLGLVDALRSECARFSQREGISIRYTPQDVPAEVPKEVALCLYRIAQEALRNIAKHSTAREARVALTATDDSILLSIEDTGVGFGAGQTRGRPGLGLDSMEERARLIGGEFTIRSEPGKGTLIEVWAPCSGERP